jgi:RimJ/RimL family protein N-acetyltransferase
VAGPRGSAFAWHTWIIRVADTDKPVGYVQATVNGDDSVAELAWVVGMPWQGRGIASDAASAVVEFVDACGVERVIAHVHPGHVASQRVAARLGLVPTPRIVDGEVEWEARSATRGR